MALLIFVALLAFAPHVLAQAPGPRPLPRQMPWTTVGLSAGIVLVLIVAGVIALVWLRRYIRDDSDVGDLTLADIRRMKDEGLITAVEYDAMRAMLIKRETARLQAQDAPEEPLK